MGLFDKLRGAVDSAVNVAKDSINKAAEVVQTKVEESAQRKVNPLDDPIIRKYFAIANGMWFSLKTKPKVDDAKTRKYFAHFLGEECDLEKLQQVSRLFELSLQDYCGDPNGRAARDYRYSIKNSDTYKIECHQAHRMFCQDEIEKAKQEYQNVLDVIKDNVNYEHFSQGMRKVSGGQFIKNIVIADSFLDGNPITQELVLFHLLEVYIDKMNDETHNNLYDYHDDVALLVLKAFHFEKFDGNKESYTTIADEDYRNFVLNVGYYKSEIDDNPFDKEEYTQEFAQGIKKRKVFDSYLGDGIYHIECENDYFCDAVCNLAWKAMASSRDWTNEKGENVSDSTDLDTVFRIVCAYLENPDAE